MRKMIVLTLVISVAMSSVSFAETLKCKSANYSIVVDDNQEYSTANYGINGKMNDGAEVELGKSYLSEKVIALSLTVDGQENKFELSATKTGPGKLIGKIFTGNVSQNATCTRL